MNNPTEINVLLSPEEITQVREALALNKDEDRYRMFSLPPHASRLYLAQDIVMYSAKPRPNWFRRFWLWVFFGWRWTNIETPQDGAGVTDNGS